MKTRTAPFPPPTNPEYPTLAWALKVFDEWLADGRPDLDGPPAEQWRIAMAVVRGDRRASRQPEQKR